MELVTLNSNHQEDKLVEKYDSLIWTERFSPTSEFQLQTGDIDRFMDILPEGKVVSLRDSTVPMIVETHQIDRKKNQPTNLIIKGRSYESILDRRASVKALIGGSADWAVVAKQPSDAAFYAINQVCVAGVVQAADIFPDTVVRFAVPADYLTATGPNRSFTIPRGNLLTTIATFLQTETKADATTIPPTPAVMPHGIRAIRPQEGSDTWVVIDIYTGTDRSDEVYFDGSRDLLDDGSYLFSKVGSATSAYVLGSATAVALEKGTVQPTGMDRRVILVDGTSAGVTNEASLVEQGKTSLSEAKETAMFDGSINQELSSYTYNVDYFLGDTVKLVGDYGLVEKARVTEYIRSEDKNGTKSYPTLVTLDN